MALGSNPGPATQLFCGSTQKAVNELSMGMFIIDGCLGNLGFPIFSLSGTSAAIPAFRETAGP